VRLLGRETVKCRIPVKRSAANDENQLRNAQKMRHFAASLCRKLDDEQVSPHFFVHGHRNEHGRRRACAAVARPRGEAGEFKIQNSRFKMNGEMLAALRGGRRGL